jgi:hypothetical protein
MGSNPRLQLHGSGRRRFLPLREARALILRRRHQPNDESGAILVLALVFLVAVSLIVVSLLSWSGASLLSTTAFGNERSVEYAATSAVDLAIQNTRYSYESQFLTNTTPQPCLGSGVTPPAFTEGVNNTTVQVTIDVYCTMTWNPSSSETRIITYSACPTTDNFTASQCAQTPLLQAVVSFDDYAGITSPPPDCDNSSESSCGLTMAQLSWTWRPVAPAVTSLTNSSGPITGGTTPTLQINGTGFVNGSTVNFIEESGGTPSTSLQGFFSNLPTTSSAGCAPPTCLTVMPPAITEGVGSGVGYYVTVTTPATGTSLETANAVYTYTASTPPTLTSISGSIPSGQSTFTVSNSTTTNGSPTVSTTGSFSNVAPGMPVTGNGIPSGTSVLSVNSATSITLSANATASGASTLTFTQEYVGGSITGGTVVTITGTGFVNGANPPTVNFICVSGCTPGATYQASPTLVDVESDTTMTAVSPNQLTSPSPGTYYIQVITVAGSAGSSSNTSDLYDYTTQVPIVTNLSAITGTAGSIITVSGGNFLSASSVTFVEESGGTAASNFTVNGTTTNGSPNVSTTGSFSNVAPGMPVTGNGIPSGTTVLSVNSTTSIKLSANATASGTSTLTFTPSIPGTSVSVTSATSLQVTTPASVPAPTTFFVVVSWTLNSTTFTSQTYNVTSSNPDGDVYTFTNT